MEKEKTLEEGQGEVQIPREEAGEVGAAVLKAARERQVERDKSGAEHWAGEVRTVEKQFAEQLVRVEERGETQITEEEFLVWERDAAEAWKRMREAEADAGLDPHERAVVERGAIAYANPHENDKSIEGQSGIFYFARVRKLMDAIKAAENEADLATVKKFPDAVAEHLRFKYTPRDELGEEYDTGNPTSTWQRVDEARNRAHNNSIQQLNKLNELAEKYGTPRLTFRNFRTKGYLQDLPDEEDKIAENDRACVEAYYTLAFRSEVARLVARQKRGVAYGLY